jgi:microcompartment protein CcmK/EutM
MKVARVIGTVVSSVKDENLSGLKLLIVAFCDLYGQEDLRQQLVAVDAVGAGLDEVVLIATGSSARQTEKTKGKPVDAVIMGIVDSLEVNGKFTFLKTPHPVKTASEK